MTETEMIEKRRAPKGKFRVIGASPMDDHDPEWKEDDFESEQVAKDFADKRAIACPVYTMCVYNDKGIPVYTSIYNF